MSNKPDEPKKPYPVRQVPVEPVKDPPKRPFEWDVREVLTVKSWRVE